MSFSQDVKDELKKVIPPQDHCKEAMAEARKYFTLIKKEYKIKDDVLEKRCCKRAFLREAFLILGTMSDPTKAYHFELVCQSEEKAVFLKDLINSFEDMDAKITKRDRTWSVYLKGADMIVDMLGIMEAPKAFMELENVRIVKEVRNSVNRRVNCETANLNKTISASTRQIEEINAIKKNGSLKRLSLPLQEMAEVRLKWPDATLQELAEKFDPPISKSAVNHRLRKLSEIARDMSGGNDG